MQWFTGERLDERHLIATATIAIASVGFALLVTYCSYVYLFAVPFIALALFLFFLRPEQFLHLLVFSKINLEAVTLLSFRDPDVHSHNALGIDGLLMLVLLFFSWRYFLRKGFKILTAPAARAYMVFLFICVVSLPFSSDMVMGARLLIRYASYLIIYLLVINVFDTEKKARRLATTMCLSCILPLSVGFYQAVTMTGDVENALGFNRIIGTTNHPNFFGLYLLFMILSAMSMYLYVTSPRAKLFLLVLIAALAISLVLNFYRGAWFSFAFALVVFIALLLPKGLFSKRLFLLFLAFLLIVFSIVGVFIVKIAERLEDLQQGYNTFLYRISMWELYLRAILERPITGYGIGSHWTIGRQRPHMYPEPHNTYLLLLVDTGIFGLVAYLAVLVSLFMFGVKAYQSHQSSSRMVIAIGLISMLCAILLVQQVDDLIAVDVAFTYFWFYAGIAYTLLKKGESHDGVSQSIGHYPDTQSGTIH